MTAVDLPMFRFIFPLKRYQVMVRGTGIYIEHQESGPSIGFYTTRWVDAFSSEGAARRAIALVRVAWSKRFFSQNSPLPDLSVEEMKQVNFWKARFWKTQGFALFGREP